MHSHAPLKPVWPVTRTRFPSQNAGVTLKAVASGLPEPRRLAGFPELLQVVPVSQRVHGVPEAEMTVRAKLVVGREALERLTLPHCLVALQILQRPRREYEEPAVDPRVVAFGLLLEADHLIALDLHRTEAAGRLNGGDGDEPFVLTMEIDQRLDVDLRNAVSVGQAERFVVQEGRDPLDPAAGHRVLARVHEGHPPRLRGTAMHLSAV